MTSIKRRSLNLRSTKVTAAQALSAILTIDGVDLSRIFRIIARMHRGADGERAMHSPALTRQHFLKRDAVFLSVLVYSGCSASRFPSARSD
jgi:hypothetical protein